MNVRPLAALVFLSACLTSREEFQGYLAKVADEDEDGFYARDDCDDHDPQINPDADEIVYDGVDNDCDPETLDDDLDQDGHDLAEDCDEADIYVYDGAEERCDTLDNDCDGLTDEGAKREFYYDGDSDGFGVEELIIEACSGSSTHVEQAGDCDDDDPTVNPRAVEICDDGVDNDCSGDNAGCQWTGEVALNNGLLARVDGVAHFGRTGAAADAADVDGDGAAELLVSAGFEGTGGERAGAAYLFKEAPEHLDETSAAGLEILGDAAQQNLGRVARLVDELGAFGPAVVLTAPGYREDGASGAAFVFSPSLGGEVGLGDAGVELLGEDVLGESLTIFRNHDGVDLIVSESYGGQGRVLRVAVPRSGSLDVSDAEQSVYGFEGAQLGELPRLTLLGPEGEGAGDGLTVGDVDGDGAPDLLVVGVTDQDAAGRAWLVPGPITLDRDLETDADAELLGDTPGASWGGAATLASDLDGDGFADLAMGASEDVDGGYVSFFYGPFSGVLGPGDADGTLRAESSGDDLGFSLTGGVDLDGQGPDDLIIGAPSYGGGGFRPGAVYLWPGQGL